MHEGCICVYGSKATLHYVEEYLEGQAKNKFDSIDSNNTIHGPPPTVLILAHNPSSEGSIHLLRNEGHILAKRWDTLSFLCLFIH